MKLTTSLVLALVGFVTGSEASDATSAASNATALQQACLQLPSRELILDVRHESLEYGTRRDAGEFLAAVLNVLLTANYTVRLSDDFMQSEVNYYRANLSREVPVEMSRGILSCLESSRASGVLDWNCFEGDFNRSAEPMNIERHLPWSAPPFKAKAIT